MNQEIGQWLELAKMDLEVSDYLFKTYHPKPLEIICYHCQQSSEKALKAIIIFYGSQGGLPKIHDLSFLLDQIKNMVKIDEKLYDYADTLTPYGVSLRYPNELELEERHASEALKMSKEILDWVEAHITSVNKQED